jgi:hypothetical protein
VALIKKGSLVHVTPACAGSDDFGRVLVALIATKIFLKHIIDEVHYMSK